MTLGDLLELIAGACLVAAGYLWQGAVLALAVAAVCVGYLAQVHAKVALPKVRRSPKTSTETAEP